MRTGPQQPDPGHRSDEQYFAASPQATSKPSLLRTTIRGLDMELLTDRGVFSPTRVDPGTRILIESLPDLSHLPEGDLVDLGCGYGPIACMLATLHPERHVWAVDVNERARDLCAANAKALGLRDRVTVLSGSERPDSAVVAVVSNPPVRIGKQALHDLLLTWLGLLVDSGEAWLVMHRHLGADSLARWLEETGWSATRVRSKQGYRVLRVTRKP